MHLSLRSTVIAAIGVTLIANASMLSTSSWQGFRHADTRLSTAVNFWVLYSCMEPPYLVPAFDQLIRGSYANRTVHLPRDLFHTHLAGDWEQTKVIWMEHPPVLPSLPLDASRAIAQVWYNPFVFSPNNYRLNEARHVEPPLAQRYPMRILFFPPPKDPDGEMQMVRFGNTLAIVPLDPPHDGMN